MVILRSRLNLRRYVLTGTDKDSCILAFSNRDGIGLTADNHAEDLSVTGQVSIITRTALTSCASLLIVSTSWHAIAGDTASSRRNTESTCIKAP